MTSARIDAALVCAGLGKSFYSPPGVGDLLRGRFRTRRIDVVRGVDLTLNRGEVLGVLGKNGAGKSTLLKLIAGLLLPDRGSVKIAANKVRGSVTDLRQSISYIISDERSFAWRLSARQNLLFFAALYGCSGKSARDKVIYLLERVGLARDAERTVKEFSSGMRQRLAIARGLLSEPSIFLLDEPTRGIDPVGAKRMQKFFVDEVFAERSVIIATHDLGEASDLCDRVLVLARGRIATSGPGAEARRLVMDQAGEQ